MSNHDGAERHIHITVNGSTTVDVDGDSLPLSPGERIVVAGLVLGRQLGTSTGALIRLRWPEGTAPTTARQSLQNSISRIRRKTGIPLTLHHGRYHLGSGVRTDVDRLQRSRERDTPCCARDDQDEPTAPAWFADLPDIPTVIGERERLDRALDSFREHRVALLRRDGRTADALVLATRRRTAHPGRESLWCAEIELLLAAGRRLEAAALYRQGWRALTADGGDLPGFDLKRLEAWIWGDAVAPTAEPDHGLVGRGDDVRDVQDQLAGTGTVVIVAPAGYGKSRLVTAVGASWPGTTTTINCSHSRVTALRSITDLLEPTGRDRALSPGTSIVTLVEELVATLRGTSLLVLDDVDRLAPLSREILMRTLARVDCRVLASSRVAGCTVPGRADVTMRTLNPLGLPALATLANVSRVEAGILVSLVGDSPEDVLALSRACWATGTAPASLCGVAAAARVPDPIAQVLGRRLRRDPPGVRRLVDHVALGIASDGSTVDPVTLGDALSPRGPLVHDGAGRLHLAHPLLRRVVLDTLPPGLREEALLLSALGLGAPHADGVAGAVRAAERDEVPMAA